MKRWQIISLLVLAFAYVALRASDGPLQPANPTQDAVAGVCVALSEVDDEPTWKLDQLRRSALAVIGEHYPKGSFSPPAWMVAELEGLGDDATPVKLRQTFRDIGERLHPAQSSNDFKFGLKVVADLRGPPKPAGGKCEDCNGTGKVGDGRIFTECLACGGDGKIDDSDLKGGNPFEVDEVSNQREDGDQKSRDPVGVITGGDCGSTRSRVAFPVLRRLLNR